MRDENETKTITRWNRRSRRGFDGGNKGLCPNHGCRQPKSFDTVMAFMDSMGKGNMEVMSALMADDMVWQNEGDLSMPSDWFMARKGGDLWVSRRLFQQREDHTLGESGRICIGRHSGRVWPHEAYHDELREGD